MDYLNPLNLDVVGHSCTVSCESEVPTRRISSLEHSALAMRAAREMRRSKHKVKTGHKVCHHLLQMINESVDQPVPRSARRFHGLKHQPPSENGSQSTMSVVEMSPANDRQFSLAF